MAGSDTDEFEIKATGPEGERIWTRSTYDVAKYIADSTITKLGYHRAQVVNTFGGHRSDVLYEVKGINKSVTHSRDAVADERRPGL